MTRKCLFLVPVLVPLLFLATISTVDFNFLSYYGSSYCKFCKLGGHIREAEPGSKDCTGEHLRPKSKCPPQHLYQGKNQGCPKNSDGL